MWHVTCDLWHVTGGGRWTFSKNFSFLAWTAWEGRFVEYLEEKAHGLTELINYKGVCRTAPATPGLLISCKRHVDSMYAQANLVPVTDNFQWPDTDSLPEDIRAVGYFNSVRWVHDYQVLTLSVLSLLSQLSPLLQLCLLGPQLTR